jgi:hypothetical protein
MKSIAKSVKVISLVIDLLLGANFVSPTEKTLKDYPESRYSF